MKFISIFALRIKYLQIAKTDFSVCVNALWAWEIRLLHRDVPFLSVFGPREIGFKTLHWEIDKIEFKDILWWKNGLKKPRQPHLWWDAAGGMRYGFLPAGEGLWGFTSASAS